MYLCPSIISSIFGFLRSDPPRRELERVKHASGDDWPPLLHSLQGMETDVSLDEIGWSSIRARAVFLMI